MPHNVVIVESPAKAKTINKYLGSDYTVIASYGHIRDLPPRDGSVRPDDDFAMEWELSERASKPVDAITKAVRAADHVFLATDPDREGEAISWHIQEVLRQKKLFDKKDVKRVTFHEITKNAVLEAFRHARAVDQPLVDAYMARRALDYLVGFTLSPVLWRKLPGAKSAGRVQSVALRLVCERESEIERFTPREYWTIGTELATDKGEKVWARLSELDGKRLDKFAFGDAASAKAAAERVRAGGFTVANIEKKQSRRKPVAAFYHLVAAAGSLAQAGLWRSEDDADGAAALRGHRHWRRACRPDHLYADRWRDPQPGCHPVGAGADRQAFRRQVPAE